MTVLYDNKADCRKRKTTAQQGFGLIADGAV
jgi:hypothetical protein